MSEYRGRERKQKTEDRKGKNKIRLQPSVFDPVFSSLLSVIRLKMGQKVIKTGNSAAVTIPHGFMEALNFKVGDGVEASLDYQNGTITFTFSTGRQLRLKEPKKRRKR